MLLLLKDLLSYCLIIGFDGVLTNYFLEFDLLIEAYNLFLLVGVGRFDKLFEILETFRVLSSPFRFDLLTPLVFPW